MKWTIVTRLLFTATSVAAYAQGFASWRHRLRHGIPKSQRFSDFDDSFQIRGQVYGIIPCRQEKQCIVSAMMQLPKYKEWLDGFRERKLIKVLAGLRRAGKSKG